MRERQMIAYLKDVRIIYSCDNKEKPINAYDFSFRLFSYCCCFYRFNFVSSYWKLGMFDRLMRLHPLSFSLSFFGSILVFEFFFIIEVQKSLIFVDAIGVFLSSHNSLLFNGAVVLYCASEKFSQPTIHRGKKQKRKKKVRTAQIFQ